METADTFRPSVMVRRVKRGTGMVTPRAPVRFGLETLQPGRDRLIPGHEAVLRAPHIFVPCDRTDKQTAERMRSLTRSRRGSSRSAPDTTGAASNYGLGVSRKRPKSWGL